MITNDIVFDIKTLTSFKDLFSEFIRTFDFQLRAVNESLASQVDLCLIDVGSGSDTRLMVRQVLEWSAREASKDGGEGKQLCDRNFRRLHDTYALLHEELFASNATKVGRENLIKKSCQQVRKLL